MCFVSQKRRLILSNNQTQWFAFLLYKLICNRNHATSAINAQCSKKFEIGIYSVQSAGKLSDKWGCSIKAKKQLPPRLKLYREIGTSSAVRKMVLIIRQYPFGNNDGMIFSESVCGAVWFPPSINRTYNTYISCSIVTKSGCFDQDQVLQHALWPLCEMQLRALLSRDDASRTVEIARDLRSLDQIWPFAT